MKKIEIDYLKIKQGKESFYVCTMKASLLNAICGTNLKEMNSDKEIYQRKLDLSRVKKISDFVKRKHGVMPTSIVLNATNGLILDEKNQKMIIDVTRKDFFIVDGQHRIAGASKNNGDYEFVVSVFDKIDTDYQSELFISINNEQKKVNSSVRFSMRTNDKVKTPEKVLYDIIYKLNSDLDSPFYLRIKMNDIDTGKNKISISAFASALLGYIYNNEDYYRLKDSLEEAGCFDKINTKKLNYITKDKYFLWKFYINNREDVMFKIIFNYFNAVRIVLVNDWESYDNILCKTTGYNALVLLFKDVYYICERENNFSLDYIVQIIQGINNLSGEFSVNRWGLGKVAASNLYKEMLKYITSDIKKIDYNVLENMSEDD